MIPRLKSSKAIFAVLVAASSAAGCTTPVTELVLTIDQYGLRIGQDVDAVSVEVNNPPPGDAAAVWRGQYGLCVNGEGGSDCKKLPLTVALVPGAADPGAGVRVQVDGLRSGKKVISDAAVFHFTQGKSLRLDMVLFGNCIDNLSCAAIDQVCTESGLCMPLDPSPLSDDDAAFMTPPDAQIDAQIDASRALPDLSAPDSSTRDSSSPPPAPDLSMPDLSTPDLSMPDLSMSDLSMPDLSMPDLSMPLPPPDLTIVDLYTPPDITLPPSAQLAFTAPPPFSVVSQKNFSTSVSVENGSGQVLDLTGVTISLALNANVPGRSFLFSGTSQRTTTHGTAVFDNLSVDTPQGYSLVAQADGATDANTPLYITGTWKAQNAGIQIGPVSQVTMTDSGTLYAATSTGLYYTTSITNVSWSRAVAGPPNFIDSMVAMPGTDQVLIISDQQIWSGGPDLFQSVYSFVAGDVPTITADLSKPGNFYAAGVGVILESLGNGGTSFTPVVSSGDLYTAIAADAGSVYATSGISRNLWTSTDGGATWSNKAVGLPNIVAQLAIGASGLYASVGGTVFVYDGSTFNLGGFPATGGSPGPLFVDPSSRQLYVPIQTSYGNVLYPSGASWNSYTPVATNSVSSVFIDAARGIAIEAINSSSSSAGSNLADTGVLIQQNGSGLEAENNGLDSFASSALVGDGAGGLYVVVGGLVYAWDGASDVWRYVQVASGFITTALQSFGAGKLYAIGSPAGVAYSSTDGGQSWSQQGGAPTLQPPMGASPAAAVLDGATPSGPVYSLDGGKNWTLQANGLAQVANIRAIAVGALGEQYVYTDAVYSLSPGASSWVAGTGLPSGTIVNGIATHPTTPGVAWLATSNGVYSTTTGGASYSSMGLAIPVSGVAVDASNSVNPPIVYAWLADGSIQSTVDGGAHWTSLSAGIGSAVVGMVTLSDDVGGLFVASASNGIYQSTVAAP